MSKTIRNEGFHVAGVRRFVQFVEFKGKEYDFPPDRDVAVAGPVADYVLANFPGKGFKLVAVATPAPAALQAPAAVRASTTTIATAAARSVRPGTPENPATAAEIADSERRTPASPPPAPAIPPAPEVAPVVSEPAPVKSASKAVGQVTLSQKLAAARAKIKTPVPSVPAKKVATPKAKK